MIFQEHWSKLRLSFFFPNVIWLFRNVRLHKEKPKYKFLKIDIEMRNLITWFNGPPKPKKYPWLFNIKNINENPKRSKFSENLKQHMFSTSTNLTTFFAVDWYRHFIVHLKNFQIILLFFSKMRIITYISKNSE